jgi:hypothetical protein
MKKQDSKSKAIQFKPEFEYNFWFWRNKFDMVMNLLALLIDYNFMDGELEGMLLEIKATDEENMSEWSGGLYYGKKDVLFIKLAKGSENKDMIYVFIASAKNLSDRIEFIDLIQNNYKLIERYI